MRVLPLSLGILALLLSGCASEAARQEPPTQTLAEASADLAMALSETMAKTLGKLHFSRGDVRRLRGALTQAKADRPAEVTLKSGLKASCTPAECVIPFPVDIPPSAKVKIDVANQTAKLRLKPENVQEMQAAMDKAHASKTAQPAGEGFLCTSSECQPQLPKPPAPPKKKG